MRGGHVQSIEDHEIGRVYETATLKSFGERLVLKFCSTRSMRIVLPNFVYFRRCLYRSAASPPEGATRRDLPEARRPNGERRTTPRTAPQGTGRGAEGDNSAGRTDREVAATAGASGQPEDPDGRTVEALPDRTGQPATIEPKSAPNPRDRRQAPVSAGVSRGDKAERRCV
jgi:hypothetical protein